MYRVKVNVAGVWETYKYTCTFSRECTTTARRHPYDEGVKGFAEHAQLETTPKKEGWG